MLNNDRMDIAGNVLTAATKGLTNEEVGRMLIVHAPGGMEWAVGKRIEAMKDEIDRRIEVTRKEKNAMTAKWDMGVIEAALKGTDDDLKLIINYLQDSTDKETAIASSVSCLRSIAKKLKKIYDFATLRKDGD